MDKTDQQHKKDQNPSILWQEPKSETKMISYCILYPYPTGHVYKKFDLSWWYLWYFFDLKKPISQRFLLFRNIATLQNCSFSCRLLSMTGEILVISGEDAYAAHLSELPQRKITSTVDNGSGHLSEKIWKSSLKVKFGQPANYFQGTLRHFLRMTGDSFMGFIKWQTGWEKSVEAAESSIKRVPGDMGNQKRNEGSRSLRSIHSAFCGTFAVE